MKEGTPEGVMRGEGRKGGTVGEEEGMHGKRYKERKGWEGW
jgi:hypothetical protein